MIINQKTSTETKSLICKEEKIEPVTKEYLGVITSKDGKMEQEIANIVATKIYYNNINFGKKKMKMPVKLQVHNMVTVPTLFYE